jgi:hypothetical protein
MAQKLIRDIPDQAMEAFDQIARAAGKNAEQLIREMIIEKAQGPIIRERYAIKFYNASNEGKGRITRRSSDLNGTTGTYVNLNENEAKAVEMATDLVRRNGQGDLAEAMWNLKNVFDHVFEEPV